MVNMDEEAAVLVALPFSIKVKATMRPSVIELFNHFSRPSNTMAIPSFKNDKVEHVQFHHLRLPFNYSIVFHHFLIHTWFLTDN